MLIFLLSFCVLIDRALSGYIPSLLRFNSPTLLERSVGEKNYLVDYFVFTNLKI